MTTRSAATDPHPRTAPDEAARVAWALDTMIPSCGPPPGTDHLEDELGTMPGASITPVRGAAAIPQGRRLVEAPGDGRLAFIVGPMANRGRRAAIHGGCVGEVCTIPRQRARVVVADLLGKHGPARV